MTTSRHNISSCYCNCSIFSRANFTVTHFSNLSRMRSLLYSLVLSAGTLGPGALGPGVLGRFVVTPEDLTSLCACCSSISAKCVSLADYSCYDVPAADCPASRYAWCNDTAAGHLFHSRQRERACADVRTTDPVHWYARQSRAPLLPGNPGVWRRSKPKLLPEALSYNYAQTSHQWLIPSLVQGAVRLDSKAQGPLGFPAPANDGGDAALSAPAPPTVKFGPVTSTVDRGGGRHICRPSFHGTSDIHVGPFHSIATDNHYFYDDLRTLRNTYGGDAAIRFGQNKGEDGITVPSLLEVCKPDELKAAYFETLNVTKSQAIDVDLVGLFDSTQITHKSLLKSLKPVGKLSGLLRGLKVHQPHLYIILSVPISSRGLPEEAALVLDALAQAPWDELNLVFRFDQNCPVASNVHEYTPMGALCLINGTLNAANQVFAHHKDLGAKSHRKWRTADDVLSSLAVTFQPGAQTRPGSKVEDYVFWSTDLSYFLSQLQRGNYGSLKTLRSVSLSSMDRDRTCVGTKLCSGYGRKYSLQPDLEPVQTQDLEFANLIRRWLHSTPGGL